MELLIIGMKGRVLGIDKANGDRAWETHLKSSGFVNVSVESDRVYASTRGELFCLEAGSGRLVWHNRMKGLGYGMVCFGSDPANQAIQAAQLAAQQQAAAAAAGGAGGAVAAG